MGLAEDANYAAELLRFSLEKKFDLRRTESFSEPPTARLFYPPLSLRLPLPFQCQLVFTVASTIHHHLDDTASGGDSGIEWVEQYYDLVLRFKFCKQELVAQEAQSQLSVTMRIKKKKGGKTWQLMRWWGHQQLLKVPETGKVLDGPELGTTAIDTLVNVAHTVTGVIPSGHVLSSEALSG